MKKRLTMMRVVLIILAVYLVLIPIMIVGITGNGLGELVSHVLISASILSVIGAVLIGINRQNKNKLFAKLGVSIGLLIVLLSLWL